MSSNESLGRDVGSGLGGLIKAVVNGKNPKDDALGGAGIATFGLSAFGVVTGAVVTVPAILMFGILGAGIGFFGGQNKKDRGG